MTRHSGHTFHDDGYLARENHDVIDADEDEDGEDEEDFVEGEIKNSNSERGKRIRCICGHSKRQTKKSQFKARFLRLALFFF